MVFIKCYTVLTNICLVHEQTLSIWLFSIMSRLKQTIAELTWLRIK